jgi:three-Cys-motif partner protein
MTHNNIQATIDTAHPHTIKKFELIEAYVKGWAQKLLNYQECNGIVFIDCMSNSGIYQDNSGNEVIGTPIRVSKYLSETMKSYPSKKAQLYFNDLSAKKIDILKKHIPPDTDNFHVETRTGDGNAFLKTIKIPQTIRFHYLIVYDPYEASIDWGALMPFINNWGDIIINHMVSDSIRAISQVKRASAIEKYEQTYLSKMHELAILGSDKDVFENRIQEIMKALRNDSKKRYYIASFPFFNMRNTVVYNLILGSGNIAGFKLFKQTAWKIFRGKSSGKNTHGKEKQLTLGIVEGESAGETLTDEYCYYVKDIAKYLYSEFKGKADVPLTNLWKALDEHPVFPSEGYSREIKKILEDDYSCNISKSSITFPYRR